MRQPGVVVLSASYDPGWTATVNGRPQPVRMVAPALVAVDVPAGTDRVAFRFRGYGDYPVLFALGDLALAAAAVGPACIGYVRRRRLSGFSAGLPPGGDQIGWAVRAVDVAVLEAGSADRDQLGALGARDLGALPGEIGQVMPAERSPFAPLDGTNKADVVCARPPVGADEIYFDVSRSVPVAADDGDAGQVRVLRQEALQ
ncbi:MAG: YfhO family protein [Trebonia sp.]